jgi:hypothetical protein
LKNDAEVDLKSIEVAVERVIGDAETDVPRDDEERR